MPVGLLVLLGICLFVFSAALASAARVELKHKDGTVVEGEVVSETYYEIQIKTKYGNLRYDKEDLEVLKRFNQETTSSVAGGAPRLLVERIPRGPIDPLRPPEIKALVGKSEQTTSASAPLAPTIPAATATTASATSQ